MWGPSLEAECELPCNLGKPPTPYLNEDERNVHVWMSEPVFDEETTWNQRSRAGEPQDYKIRLLAGAYCGTGCETIVPETTFYKWMRYIYYPSNINAENFYNDHGSPDAEYRLLVVQDPRKFGLPLPNSYHSLHQIRCEHGLNMREGHYILVCVVGQEYVGYQRRDRKALRTGTALAPCTLSPQLPAISHRDMTGSIGTGTGRFEFVIWVVAPALGEHPNVGEVGIFVVSKWLIFFLWVLSTRTYADFWAKLGIAGTPRSSNIDVPQNAIVLRSDLHEQFDQYEFGFEKGLTRAGAIGHRVRIFEKTSAAGNGVPWIGQAIKPTGNVLTGHAPQPRCKTPNVVIPFTRYSLEVGQLNMIYHQWCQIAGSKLMDLFPRVQYIQFLDFVGLGYLCGRVVGPNLTLLSLRIRMKAEMETRDADDLQVVEALPSATGDQSSSKGTVMPGNGHHLRPQIDSKQTTVKAEGSDQVRGKSARNLVTVDLDIIAGGLTRRYQWKLAVGMWFLFTVLGWSAWWRDWSSLQRERLKRTDNWVQSVSEAVNVLRMACHPLFLARYLTANQGQTVPVGGKNER
ncbi:hypothetical protein B0H14DRAFT_2610463 [Mycena olivaceomarginata]|nr:hypothetical protein B0H14DRAFT_2610463 [Mycena olivaceomarginata]